MRHQNHDVATTLIPGRKTDVENATLQQRQLLVVVMTLETQCCDAAPTLSDVATKMQPKPSIVTTPCASWVILRSLQENQNAVYFYFRFYSPKLSQRFFILCLLYSVMYKVLFERSNRWLFSQSTLTEVLHASNFSFMILKVKRVFSQSLYARQCYLKSALRKKQVQCLLSQNA